MKEIGATFQKQTSYTPEKISGRGLDWSRKPLAFKRYDATNVSLKTPEIEGGQPLWNAMQTRRSYRDFTKTSIPLEVLSQLLWAMQGVTAIGGDTLFRTAPSAGGLFPIETYLIVNNVEGLNPGLYHLFLPEWELEFLSPGSYGPRLAQAALGQGMMARAAVDFIWTAMIYRSAWKYEQRAYRYIYLDAAHICQNLYLACESLGLGCCAVGAFFDSEANQLIGVDGNEETVLYMAAVGNKQS
jgi:SagB-type dehydrogenase family enzyme